MMPDPNADSSQREPRVTVFITEALAIVRAGLRALLADVPGLTVVGNTGDLPSLLDAVAECRPDVLLLVPNISQGPDIRLLEELRNRCPGTRVVLLAEPRDQGLALNLLQAGAPGCFLKSDRPGELIRGIRAAAAGELAVSSTVARWLLGQGSGAQHPQPTEPLTEREREVLGLLNAGLSNKEIAQTLYLSVRTVEVHLRSIYGKLGVRSRLEAVTRPPQAG
ncbi:MAG TPA: response regulator transcription factor [Thermoleophilia bacterium]|nr:response regulator transcription factor [Thermoleophilia bacterium]